jgi:leucyl aminopeptidase (aminopeptidase T)
MDYRKVALFVERLIEAIGHSSSIAVTSAGGTNLKVTHDSPPRALALDGLIKPAQWQNLPSGQVIVLPRSAEGTYVVDRVIGDWFQQKYDVSRHPVTITFEQGRIRNVRCENRKLAHELGLFVRSSENSGRISELVIGANLGLSGKLSGALYEGYRPGSSIAVGSSHLKGADLGWTAPTFLPLIGQRATLLAGNRLILQDDSFAADLAIDVSL